MRTELFRRYFGLMGFQYPISILVKLGKEHKKQRLKIFRIAYLLKKEIESESHYSAKGVSSRFLFECS
jgi:hypothetical protein